MSNQQGTAARLALAASIVAILAVTAACSGGSKKSGFVDTGSVISGTIAPGTPGTSDETPPADFTPLTGEQETVVAQGPNVPFDDYTDPGGRYTAMLPHGWTIMPSDSGVLAHLPTNGVTMAIDCYVGQTADELIVQDERVQQNVGFGVITRQPETKATISGVTARVRPWSTTIGTVFLERVFVYFDGKGCGWRISLNGTPGYPISMWSGVLKRVMDSFKFTA